MADKIKLLPEFVANQIAAGEVVNRPSSVVKEMVENAVDAGAKNITVSFRDGGKALIKIIDDGAGMSPVDARLAFDRHATSKIDAVDDIYHLGTFGFRGEALASIASVAEVELRTRQEGQELGTQIEIAGGRFVGQTPVNCPVGSQFSVRNLFYNVPARRRFLDKSSTESRHILAEYQRVALCNPDIAFSLYDNDSIVSKLPPSSLRQRVVGVIGKAVAKDLLDVNADTSIVRVEGFVGRPASAKQTNKQQFLFVNGRYFKSPYFHKAVLSAYEKLIAPNTQPSYFLYFTIAPERIDVNVHPQKTEIKFENGTEIWQIINAAVREALAKSGAVPAMDFDMDTSVEIPVYRPGMAYKVPEIKGNPDFNPFERYSDITEGGDEFAAGDAAADFASSRGSGAGSGTGIGGRMGAGRDSRADFTDFELPRDWRTEQDDYESSVLEFIEGGDGEQTALSLDCGAAECGPAMQIGIKYAATVRGGALLLVDIRRAWEAVLFDRYETMLRNGSSVCQQMLFPERITLSTDDAMILGQHLADFAAFGFDIRRVDDHAVEIHGLPADFASQGAEELVYDLLDTVREEMHDAAGLRRQRLAAALARKGSAQRVRPMDAEELGALFASLAAAGDPGFTPGGLPVMTAIGEDELTRRFKKD